MTIYRCFAKVESLVYLGPIEAGSEDEAIEVANYKPGNWWPDLKTGEDHEVVEIIAEEE